MTKTSPALRNHRELLLDYFWALKQSSSGAIEGLNNKAKVTMIKAYGFRTFRAKAQHWRYIYALGKLPELALAARFY